MRRYILLSLFSGLLLQAQEFSHFQGYVGGGFTTPRSSFGDRHDSGWNFLGGGGYRFNPAISLNLEYSFNSNNYGFTPDTAAGAIIANRYDGHTELHGFTLNPRYTFDFKRGGLGAYVTGGYGVFARNFSLTRPGFGTTVVCDPYWYWCGTAIVPVDFVLGSRTTWKQGWNAGLGVEFGARVKFFAEARYLWVATPQVRVQSIPATFGLRF